MKNIIGLPTEEANHVVREELDPLAMNYLECGFEINPWVSVNIVGILQFKKYKKFMICKRCDDYYSILMNTSSGHNAYQQIQKMLAHNCEYILIDTTTKGHPSYPYKILNISACHLSTLRSVVSCVEHLFNGRVEPKMTLAEIMALGMLSRIENDIEVFTLPEFKLYSIG